MLTDAHRTQLVAALANIRTDVCLDLEAGTDDQGMAMVELAAALAAANPAVRVVRADSASPPVLSVRAAVDTRARIRFAGVPTGHEFTSLVLAVLHVGGHPPRMDLDRLAALDAITDELVFETVYAPSCRNCPDVVQALNALAARNPKVSHIAYDGSQHPDLVAARNVLAVPAVFCNGVPFVQGRMDPDDVLDRVAATARLSPVGSNPAPELDLAAKTVFDVLVVGAGPAGASAAIYAARKGLKTAVVADRFGGQVLDTDSIENLVSVPHTDGTSLARDLEDHVRKYPVECLLKTRATALIPGTAGGRHTIITSTGAALEAGTVVLAPGARWRTLDVPGESEYRNKGVTFCPHCDGPLFAHKHVAVIGAGNSGIEAAIDLSYVAAHVTVIDVAPVPRADAVLLATAVRRTNIELRCGTKVQRIVGNGAAVSGLVVESVADATVTDLTVAGVFVQIGLVPNTEWLPAEIVRNTHGEIVVDAGATSLAGVFAAGDATDAGHKQIVTALGTGAEAALAAFEHLTKVS